MRQLHLSVVVPHGTNLPGALAVAREVTAANPRVLKDPAPVVGAAQIEPLGVRLGIHPWVRVPDVVPAEAELYEALVQRFGTAGIGVPLPRQEVRL